MLKHTLPHMRSQKSGHIVSISSMSALWTQSGLGFYGGSKAALEALHRAEAPILERWNIKMTLVQPATAVTESEHMVDKIMEGEKIEGAEEYTTFMEEALERFRTYLNFCPLTSDDVSELVLQILATENPDFQYQSGAHAQIAAEALWKDPTGNSFHQVNVDEVDDYL
eukprot:TRINITY_DN5799_c0_g1_i1.p1 TRINITY_DN5799_c0_g1~~TRINITY_DN5799_c0_g1_i1.p1  ORF type:complete len:168 (-),score=46.04 TRINITY_DN5799_c0_g1_i1:58-561(-)